MRSGRIEISAASIVVPTGRRRAAPLLTLGRAGMLKTFGAIASPAGSVRGGPVGGSALPAAPDRVRGKRHGLRQRLRQAVIDNQHVAELRQLDKRLDPRSAGVDRG